MNDDYSYLSGLSPEAQQIIITKVEQGEVNLYHSIMAVLEGRRKRENLRDCVTENKHYRKYSKRKTDLSNISEPLFNEIFNYVYGRFTNKTRPQVRQQLTTKENMTISKGAMVLALQACKVSDKNIMGMLGVMDTILHKTSENKLKSAYREYLLEHQEEQ